MEEEFFDHHEEIEHATENAAKKNFGFHDGGAEAANALNELLAAHLPFDVDMKVSQRSWRFTFPGLEIQVQDLDGIQVNAQSNFMPRRRLDPLRQELRTVLADAVRELPWDTLSLGTMLLRIVEEASWHMREFHNTRLPKTKEGHPGGGWDASLINDWSKVLDNPHGVNLATVSDTAKHILGRPISEILKNLPDELRILHVEPVFRSDLVCKFLTQQKRIQTDLQTLGHNNLRSCINPADLTSKRVVNSVEGMAEHLSKATVTFHGAPRSRVSSIVRHGFIVPGKEIGNSGTKLEIRCGASYGIGIYSSPSLEYASIYGQGESLSSIHPGDIPGFRMLVCATLMGAPLNVNREDTRRTTGLSDEKGHSHVSPNKLEYIVFNSAQIIPCYVLHVDFGSDIARRHLDEVRKNPSRLHQFKATKSRVQSGYDEDDAMWPAAKKAKKEAIKAAATKWFPYGFGPATGTRFVIEEIGDVSDDEEDYGEYQALRGEHSNEIQIGERSANEKTSWFDEYQTARLYKSSK